MTLTRIDNQLREELDEIRSSRREVQPQKKKMSYRKITQLITRHKHWKQIKQEIIYFVDLN